MGVNALTTRIVLQDLLQKQYEGLSFVVLGKCSKIYFTRARPTQDFGPWSLSSPKTRTFPYCGDIARSRQSNKTILNIEKDGKAKVNVNLLLHLLNKKFHTKK